MRNSFNDILYTTAHFIMQLPFPLFSKSKPKINCRFTFNLTFAQELQLCYTRLDSGDVLVQILTCNRAFLHSFKRCQLFLKSWMCDQVKPRAYQCQNVSLCHSYFSKLTTSRGIKKILGNRSISITNSSFKDSCYRGVKTLIYCGNPRRKEDNFPFNHLATTTKLFLTSGCSWS